MPSTLVANVGASNANAYATLAEYDAFLDDHPSGSDASGTSDDAKTRALLQATARIDEEDFQGSPVNPLTGTGTGTTQALKFPRYGVENEEGWTYLGTVIPEPVKEATMELALEIQAGRFAVKDTGLEGIEEVELGPLTVRPRHAQKGGELPEEVQRKLRHLLMTPSRANFRLLRS